MKKKRLQDSQVSISSATLKALKGLLFDKTGFDVSPLIKDLSTTRNEDLVALNIGLVLKGMTPEIAEEDKVRFDTGCKADKWNSTIIYYKYTFEAFSLIDGVVKYSKMKFSAPKNKDLSAEKGVPVYGNFDQGVQDGFGTAPLEHWLYDMEIDSKDILSTIREYKN